MFKTVKRILSVALCLTVLLTITACTSTGGRYSYYDEVVLSYREVSNTDSQDKSNERENTEGSSPDVTVSSENKDSQSVNSSKVDNTKDNNKDNGKDNSGNKNNTTTEVNSSKNQTTSSANQISSTSSKPKKDYKEEEWRLHPEDFKLLCLTFDDGTGYSSYNEDDPAIKIAKIVKQYHGSATYFYTGSAARGDVDVAKWLVDNGFEIGNHSNGHLSFNPYVDIATCENQVLPVNDLFKQKLGIDVKYFRGAGFTSCENLRSVLAKYEMPYIAYQFTLGSDWSGGEATAETVKNALLTRASDGAIAAGHATNKTNCTPEGLAEALPILYEQGYRFCSVGELFELRNIKNIPYGKEIRRVTPEGVVVTF